MSLPKPRPQGSPPPTFTRAQVARLVNWREHRATVHAHAEQGAVVLEARIHAALDEQIGPHRVRHLLRLAAERAEFALPDAPELERRLFAAEWLRLRVLAWTRSQTEITIALAAE